MDASLKHELRTPLNHIIGYCELMLEEEADRGRERFTSDLRRIHDVGTRLLGMINDRFEVGRDSPWHDHERLQREMREHLRGVVGEVEGLQKGLPAAAEAGVHADLERIGSAARELLRRLPELLQKDEGVDIAPPSPLTTFVRRESNSPDGRPRLSGTLLVVDDDERNRDMLTRRLTRLGHRVMTAANGREAVEALRRTSFDLMLLDLEMPGLNGYQVLELLNGDETLPRLPVIVLSASDDLPGIARCIEMGAEDYLAKPFEPVLLQARLTACLEKKRLRDREQMHLRQIRDEQDNAERLLLNILPPAIARRLKQGEKGIADSFPDATVLFGDLVGFTSLAAEIPAADVVARLNEIFSAFDQAVADLGLEKIKTIGDAYMAVGGVPIPRANHAEAIAELALRMQEEVVNFNARTSGTTIQVRIGVHAGPVVAGIIGRHKYAYDLWGNAVNVASRMESHSLPGRIQVTAAVEERLRGRYRFEPRGPMVLKGIGTMPTFFLVGRGNNKQE